MTKMKNTMLALFAATLMFAAVPALAADPAPAALSYGVVDMNKVLQTADAAKGLIAELDAKRKEFQTQLTKEETALRTSEQEILKQKDKLSAADFEKKRKEFEGKVAAAQKSVQDRKKVLDDAFAAAMTKLRTEILKASAEVAKAKGYTAVFNQEAMVLADTKADITNDVIAGVNKSVKKIDVSWK